MRSVKAAHRILSVQTPVLALSNPHRAAEHLENRGETLYPTTVHDCDKRFRLVNKKMLRD
jgi:hypothetical protein